MGSEKYIMEGVRKIPIIVEADVVVAGSGPAGIGAALACARNGARTVIIEREFALGGMMTTGLMSKIAISSTIKGIAVEIIEKLAQTGMSLPKGAPEVPIDPEATKILLDELLLRENVQIMLGSVVAGATVESGEIKAVIVENKSGRQAITAKVFIDATGDGDLAVTAGASYELGRKEDGLCSAPTLMFRIGNVDIEAMLSYIVEHPEELQGYSFSKPRDPSELVEAIHSRPQAYANFGRFNALINKVAAEREFNEWEWQVLRQRNGFVILNMPQPNQVLVNSTRILQTSSVDAQQLSNSMVEGRKQAWFLFEFLKQNLSGFQDSYIMDTAAQMGVRESRRIVGDYMLTEDDVLNQARFDDVIVRNTGGVEVHSPTGNELQIVHLKTGEWYDIPYRSILVKDLNNLLVAGRCFSATHIALSAARSIGFCMAQGQAAGTAAALAIKSGVNIRQVPISELRSLLDM
ncbi:MAG: FAD-dependent oxidoreductase [Gorillibacterium sp.]|nr:FAD-dependent oxidoreductase [Gorillibacterium sp.]